MNFLRLLPVLLSSLLLAAHFLRSGQTALVAVSLLLPLLLLVRRKWVPIVVSVALILGALEWVYTGARIAMIREQMGAPWTRMALILGGVAIWTAGSALVFRLAALKARYTSG